MWHRIRPVSAIALTLAASAPPASLAQDRAQYQQGATVTAGFAQEREQETGLPPSMNDWGETGLIQDPSARTGLEGDFNFTFSNVNPYNRYNFTLTPAPWVETVFRYSAIINRLYGPVSFSGNQRYKDRALDIKFRLVKENNTWPEIALGFRDVAGTGLFSSQYLVASRRWYNLDFTEGLAWGNMASGSSIPNPLGLLSSHFKRPTSTIANGGAGSFNPKAYFTGRDVALFGGVEWQTPIKALRLKLEYDPNNYQDEPLGNHFQDNAPINIALEYNPYPFVTLAAGVERGKTGMLRLTLHSNFNDLQGLLPIRDIPPPRHVADAQDPDEAPAHTHHSSDKTHHAQDRIARAIFAQLKAQKLTGIRFAIAGHTAYLVFANDTYRPTAMAIGRAARVVVNNVPARIDRIDLTIESDGITSAHLSLIRHDLDQALADRGSPEEIWHHTILDRDPAAIPPGTYLSKPARAYPNFSWSLEPHIRQQVGGPNNFLLFQIYAALSGEAQLRPGLTATGTLGANLYNNFNELTLPSNSTLPHVRSDIKDYLKQGATGIYRLQADQILTLAPNWYGRVSAGLLEEMFEGVDGEILYKPDNTRWAAGIDLNHVIQRGYDERFDARSYQVSTGHLNLYYQYDPSTLIALNIGRYLAGDKGATLTVTKTFDSGISVGAFATKTNVSSQQFGEGSFDKGFFISIPLDILTGNRTKDPISYLYRPLTRDGGQQLDIAKPLYNEIENNNPKSINQSWNNIIK